MIKIYLMVQLCHLFMLFFYHFLLSWISFKGPLLKIHSSTQFDLDLVLEPISSHNALSWSQLVSRSQSTLALLWQYVSSLLLSLIISSTWIWVTPRLGETPHSVLGHPLGYGLWRFFMDLITFTDHFSIFLFSFRLWLQILSAYVTVWLNWYLFVIDFVMLRGTVNPISPI